MATAGGQPESSAKRRRRRRRPRGGEEARGGRGGEAPARRAARGRAKRGPGREGWVGGRVGGERESNSRTRPERPAQRAQAARLRPAPETGGCGGRGLCPSWIPRSGSQVSPAQAVTAQRRAPLSLKWLRYRESRPAGVRTWARAAALSRCWAAGAPSTKAWPGRGDCPRGLALAPVDPPHAGGFRASCRAGLGEGEAVRPGREHRRAAGIRRRRSCLRAALPEAPNCAPGTTTSAPAPPAWFRTLEVGVRGRTSVPLETFSL